MAWLGEKKKKNRQKIMEKYPADPIDPHIAHVTDRRKAKARK